MTSHIETVLLTCNTRNRHGREAGLPLSIGPQTSRPSSLQQSTARLCGGLRQSAHAFLVTPIMPLQEVHSPLGVVLQLRKISIFPGRVRFR